eukprot:3486667-Pyramimonas_sp.AAC.4
MPKSQVALTYDACVIDLIVVCDAQVFQYESFLSALPGHGVNPRGKTYEEAAPQRYDFLIDELVVQNLKDVTVLFLSSLNLHEAETPHRPPRDLLMVLRNACTTAVVEQGVPKDAPARLGRLFGNHWTHISLEWASATGQSKT